MADISCDTRAETPAEDARVRAWGFIPDSDESDAPHRLVQSLQGFVHTADEKDNRLSLSAADLIEAREVEIRAASCCCLIARPLTR